MKVSANKKKPNVTFVNVIHSFILVKVTVAPEPMPVKLGTRQADSAHSRAPDESLLIIYLLLYFI